MSVIDLVPTSLLVGLADGSVLVSYVIRMENETFHGDIGGNSQVPVSSEEIQKKIEELRELIVLQLRSQTGLHVEESSLGGPAVANDDEDPL